MAGTLQEELLAVSDDLAQLYHHVCTVNGETPSRVVLDHAKGSRIEDGETMGEDRSCFSYLSFCFLRSSLQSSLVLSHFPKGTLEGALYTRRASNYSPRPIFQTLQEPKKRPNNRAV